MKVASSSKLLCSRGLQFEYGPWERISWFGDFGDFRTSLAFDHEYLLSDTFQIITHIRHEPATFYGFSQWQSISYKIQKQNLSPHNILCFSCSYWYIILLSQFYVINIVDQKHHKTHPFPTFTRSISRHLPKTGQVSIWKRKIWWHYVILYCYHFYRSIIIPVNVGCCASRTKTDWMAVNGLYKL